MAEKKSNATLILILGIVSPVCCCFPVGIAAFLLGRNEVAAIDSGDLPEDGRQFATIGMWLGAAGTVIGVLGLGVWIFLGGLGAWLGR